MFEKVNKENSREEEKKASEEANQLIFEEKKHS